MRSSIDKKQVTPAEKAGVYLHFPFCESKCNYCDFYSARFPTEKKQDYIAALCKLIEVYSERLSLSADTLYLGGGTPTTVAPELLAKVIKKATATFGIFSEITVEANPADRLADTFKQLVAVGVNRISLGVQSAVENELKLLGRRHTPEQVIKSVADIRNAGCDNISLDLMLGIPGQTAESLQKSIEFCLALNPQHISAYMLKVEPDTPFGRALPPGLPDTDKTADLYLLLCDMMQKAGYQHYEISNFCKPGYESRHNLKYWKQAPYLGLGPGAHSMVEGKRFYFPRDLEAFLTEPQAIPDGNGGDEDEFIMLRLRLSEGFSFAEYQQRFGKDFAALHADFIAKLQKNGLAQTLPDRLALTDRGFLLSNTIISELL